MNSIQDHCNTHCTQFMLDFCPELEKEEINSFQDYMKREDNYDLNFCAAWLNHSNTMSVNDPEQLLELFMKIQNNAIQHIQLMGTTMDVAEKMKMKR